MARRPGQMTRAAEAGSAASRAATPCRHQATRGGMRRGSRRVGGGVATAEELLTVDRSSALELLASLSADWDSIVEASAQANVDDEHDPEGATLAFERAQIEASLSRTGAHLAEIDNALRLLD